jgi:hypothetical protein
MTSATVDTARDVLKRTACGSGRVARVAAERGLKVTGVIAFLR